jgi:MYXO-CTERM domain-containing protein
MRPTKIFFLTTMLALGALEARDAAACGGCFSGPSEVTQITGEKMLLTVSQQQTTLYDQITYSGNPSSFAWVLPIRGIATVGLSSDALFQNLGQDTATTIIPPPLNCAFNSCNAAPPAALSSGTGMGGDSAGGPVTVLAQQVVGPYETVQLASTDPMALRNWLAAHSYNVPTADGPVIDQYVAEGFNFLALKLVPGMGVSAMKPVRVTTSGATPSLPLRMVAVGSGAIVPITLWVIAEGRYDTVNMPSFQLDPTNLVWDYGMQDSNYTTLKQQMFTSSNNRGWLIEAAEPFSMYELQSQLTSLVETDPVGSGYADAMGQNAQQNLAADMTTLFAGIADTSAWVTRFEGAIAHEALNADLIIAASSDQSTVSRYFQTTKFTGTAPTCPVYPPCSGQGGASGGGGSGNVGLKGESCAMSSNSESTGSVLTGMALLGALAMTRRRRQRHP